MSVDQLGVLDERYVLNAELGSGGMADVYRATDRVLRRQVAVKVLRDRTDRDHQARFVDEARTLASLNHPALITLLDAGIEADRPYLVMELAEGMTLRAVIAGGPLDPLRVAAIGRTVAEGLAYAHGRGVVHRDVKPSNILVCEDDRVLLVDFGIARLVDAVEQHTRTGEAIGSPGYLSPEQVAGEELSPAVDVYSLGLVMLEALTGVRAYAGTAVAAAVARLNAQPSIPDSLGEAWTSLLRRMTARDPADRPVAAEVVAALTGLIARGDVPGDRADAAADTGVESTRVLRLDEPVTAAEPATQVVPAGEPWFRRVDQPVVLIGAIVLALVLLVALILARPGGDGNDPAPANQLPSGVPSQLRAPLQDLHDAIEGTP